MIEIYRHTPETWDATKCEEKTQHIAQDGLGTPYPWPGYIGNHYGVTRYNGGCEREGKWYQGEHHPLPIIAPGYRIRYVSPWGYRIIKVESD